MTAKYDLLIKNGNVIDGTGNPHFKAEIGVLGGKIAAISPRGQIVEAEPMKRGRAAVNP